MAKLNKLDIQFILEQIRIAEQHALGTPLTQLIQDPLLVFGLRTVDGTFNNLIPGREEFGASDNLFPRLLEPEYRNEGDDSFTADTNGPAPGGLETLTNNNYNQMGNTPVSPGSFFVTGDVVDADPRIISNLNSNQTISNPAAVQTYINSGLGVMVGGVLHHVDENGLPGAVVAANETLFIANVAPDEGLSAPFNSWMTLFGQFFDHGLDLVTKGDNGTVYIPLQPDDPLYNPLTPHLNFMAVTRVTVDSNGEATNTTTSWIDQNQTYTSHPSHQAWLREYVLDGAGRVVATGNLLEGVNGGLATWADVKAQARNILGFDLTDADVTMVPMLAVDQYGRLLLDANGKAQIVTGLGTNTLQDHVLTTSDDTYTPGSPAALGGTPVSLATAVRFGHAFLDDIAHSAAPYYDDDRNPNTPSVLASQDADLVAGTDDLIRSTYDNELLDAHYITGDGRGNENIGLTAVHHVFHSEHNRQAEEIKLTIVQDAIATGITTDLIEWVPGFNGGLPPANATPVQVQAFADSLAWNGERIFQAARFATEMQYQHLVFEEFGRKVMPGINLFAGIQTDIDASIVAEFAHVVYRFGHSMLNETVDRIDADGNPVLSTTTGEQMGLIEAFLNPLAYAARETTEGAAAGEIINGMTRQVGNEIDQFVTGALQNNLLGLPLDLAAINMARARDAGIPSLNEARRQFFTMTGDSQLQAYTSWADFGTHLKYDDAINKESLVNFIAAYGTHVSITSATTMAEKRAAAMLLVYGNRDTNGDGIVEVAPADRIQFMNSSGAYASVNGVTTTGLDAVDFWLGGLAEKTHPFGGLLGTTFGFVFETQMERLQDGDRFYYLARTAGLNFLSELEGNSFAELIMRNTPNVGHLPGDIFSTPNFILELDQAKQFDYNPDDPNSLDPVGQVVRNNPGTPGTDSNYLEFNGGEHVVLGGTNNNDILIADIGDDTVWGDGGNDRIEGGAGNDQLIGGDGDDIITDSFGDDNIKGGAGNDVINAGTGIDLIISGDGNDFVVAGGDEKETIAGEGNDFILGSAGVDTVFGDGGSDWIEGGNSADLLQGDNGDPFRTSPILGNDVVIGGGGNDDYDMESGDDIAVGGEGTERYEGMLGFDWVTFKGDATADADMLFTGLVVPTEVLRDRFDLIEGVSGWNGNDIIRGDNTTSVELSALDPGTSQNNALNSTQQIALINGLQGLLDGMLGAPQTGFDGGNILLGGDGNDIIEGRGGNDLIDGDKWLNVQISYVDANNVEHRVNSMADIQAQLFNGTINPGQLKIVREIVQADGTGDIDTVVYNDIATNYTFSVIPDAGTGTWTVTDAQLLTAGPANPLSPFAPVLDEGIDTLRNVERLQFNDGNGGVFIVNLDPNAANVAATGAIIISNNAPTEDQALTVTALNLADINGMVNLSTLQFHWEAEIAPGIWTRVLTNSVTFTPTNAQAGQALRVVATFEDNLGHQESLISTATTAVVNTDDAPTGVDAEVIIVEDGSHTFTALDFGFSDPDVGDSFGSVEINTIPTTGILSFNGNPVANGAIIPAVDIGLLVYTPAPNANGENYASFSFTVQDSDGTPAAVPSTVWISVNTANDAPEGADKTVTINEDTSYTFAVADFGFTDLDAGDALRAVRISSLPAAGILSLNGNPIGSVPTLILAPDIAAGNLVFTPLPNDNGYVNNIDPQLYANFEFTVQDLAQAFDTTGLPNIMTINVNQVNDPATGSLQISDLTPTEGTAISVSQVLPIADIDGVGTLIYQWQSSANGVDNWINVTSPGANSANFTPAQAEVNRYLRVNVSFTDGDGNSEVITSPVTTSVVGDLYNGNNLANNPALTNGEDRAFGNGGADILRGLGGIDILNGGAGNDNLDGGNENDTLDGGLGSDILLGGDGDDILIGGTDTGADTLVGGTGVDIMTGGDGNDTYEVDNVLDQVNETAAALTQIDTVETTLTSYTLGLNVENLNFTDVDPIAFTGIGNALANRIEGGDGNDDLDGRAGIDTLIGGLGDDTYRVDVTGDITTEVAGQGMDIVLSSATYTLAAEVENLTLVAGAGNINGTGNTLANVINGNEGNNVLSGGTGTAEDTIIGGAGNDIINYIVGQGADDVDGGDDTDTLAILGTAAVDSLNVYFDGLSNRLTRVGGVNSSISSVEIVTADLLGGADTLSYNGIGGTTANVTVNLGTSSASGFTTVSGIEVVTGGSGNDSLTGNAIIATTLNGGAGNDTLVGGGAIDILNGGDDDDTLDGGALNDTMTGGLGNDTYLVNVFNDTVTEAAGAGTGTDTVLSTAATYTLATNVENLTLTGTANISGTGNTLDNVLTGNSGDNTLNGGTGADTLNGGLGNDTLIGGTGNTIDIINGEAGDDTINYIVGEGADVVDGGADNDTLAITGTTGNDTLSVLYDGARISRVGGGNVSNLEVVTANLGLGTADLLSYNGPGGTTANVTVNLSTSSASGFTSVSGVEVVTGGSGNDSLTGNASIATTLNGGVGNDTLIGGGAIDILNGGDNDDTLDGGLSNDTMTGGLGNDTYLVNVFNDTVTEAAGAGTGTDTVRSTALTYTLATNVEDLVLVAGAGAINGTGNGSNNIMTGNSDNNILSGLGGIDTLFGGDGADDLTGGTANDIVNGEAGNDLIRYFMGDGADTTDGGADTDELRVTGTAGNDTLDVIFSGGSITSLEGGSVTGIESIVADLVGQAVGGADTLNYGTTASNVTVNLALGTASGFTSITGIENVTTGVGNDTLIGNIGNNILNGGTGIDTYDLSAIVNAVSINLTTATGADIGTDTLTNIENIIGSQGDDFINLNGGVNRIEGGNGIDTINAGGGNDTLIGGDGNDTLNGGTGFDTFVFQAAGFDSDTITGASLAELFDSDGGLGAQDFLDISGLGISNATFAGSVNIAASGVNTVITIGADQITLVGVSSATVDVNDFILAP